MQAFVFDTYALLEVISGNSQYARYLSAKAIINDFIFAELYYKLIREISHEKADFYANKYAPFMKQLDIETIKEAMLFRAQHKKKNFSSTDSISYVMALKLNIKFLTGDNQFKELRGVEFVK